MFAWCRTYLIVKNSRVRLVYRQRTTTRTHLRDVLQHKAFINGLVSLFVFTIFFIDFNFTAPEKASAQTDETLSSGSFIINMGVTPQTFANGLKPYGMVYDLIYNYNVPVKWIINSTKSKDGADFTYSGTDYKGGPFIVRAEDITTTVSARITYWQGQGVQGTYTTSSITVPVYATLTYFPKAMVDNLSNNDDIITGYFTDAGVSSSAYTIGDPSQLTSCFDIWLNPHGDPAWSTHSYLYDFVTTQKSSIWSQCHAVSVMEGVTNTSSPFQQMNYLTTTGLKCYSSGKCGSGVTQTHSGSPTSPYTHNYPTDPVMQFMSTMDGATDGGSEKWYIPQTTGAWRGTTRRLVTTADGTSPGEGILMAYGPAYGNSNYGYVMYEGGHDLDGNGSTTEKVAAVRAFFNFLLVTGTNKQVNIISSSVPSSMGCLQTSQVYVKVGGGTAPYTYAWSSTVGGSFANSAADTTNYTSPNTASVTGVIKCVITDACGRRTILSSIITAGCSSPLPITLRSFSVNEFNGLVNVDWKTETETNNHFFTLFRSSDALNFSEIARVDGIGTSSETHSYSFLDEHPLDGNNYYRLSQTDFDGTTKVVGTRTINMKAPDDPIYIYPNPFDKIINIRLAKVIPPTIISLIDARGKLIYRDELNGQEKNYEYLLHPRLGISPGIYFVCVSLNREKRVIKVLKN